MTRQGNKCCRGCGRGMEIKYKNKIAPTEMTMDITPTCPDCLEEKQVTTGYKELDEIVKGFVPGKLYCLSSYTHNKQLKPLHTDWVITKRIETHGYEVVDIGFGKFEIWKDFELQATVKLGSGLFNFWKREILDKEEKPE